MRGGRTKAAVEKLLEEGWEFAGCDLRFTRRNNADPMFPPEYCISSFTTPGLAGAFYETFKAMRIKEIEDGRDTDV